MTQSGTILHKKSILNWDKKRKSSFARSQSVPGSHLITCVLVGIICFGTFIYWSLEALNKYKSEPLSTTTFEERSENEVLPSLSVCRFPLSAYSVSPKENYTLDDMKASFDADIVHIIQG